VGISFYIARGKWHRKTTLIITSPAIVINSSSGSYLLTSAMVDGQEAKVFQVLDDLLAREKQILNKQN
jgi:hypothetical protein